jgi:hypothetical protein
MNFKQFFKEESDISIRRMSRHWDGTEVTFLINDKEYTYHIETGHILYNKELKRHLKYAPSKAFRFIKKHGELIKKH